MSTVWGNPRSGCPGGGPKWNPLLLTHNLNLAASLVLPEPTGVSGVAIKLPSLSNMGVKVVPLSVLSNATIRAYFLVVMVLVLVSVPVPVARCRGTTRCASKGGGLGRIYSVCHSPNNGTGPYDG